MSRLIVLHRTFDKEVPGAMNFTVAEKGKKVQSLQGIKLDAFVQNLKRGDVIRVTSTAYFLPVLEDISSIGVKFETCHWHATGISRGLDAKGIVLAFLDLPSDIFRPITFRGDLHRLRTLIMGRQALMKYRKSVFLQLKSTTRSVNLKDDDSKENHPWLQEMFDDAETLQDNAESLTNKQINAQAAQISECIQMNGILNIKGSWITSASLMAYLGDMGRFPSVSALWHYSGQHVVNGKAPKRAKGQTITWNPNLRTALWVWVDSMLKTKNAKWRPIYDAFLAKEMQKNADRPEKERISDVHCGRRARRLVTKQVLKEVWETMSLSHANPMETVAEAKPSRFKKTVKVTGKVPSARKKIVKPVRKVVAKSTAKRKLAIAA